MVELPGAPQPPFVPVTLLMRSFSGVVDQATTVVAQVVTDPKALDSLPPTLQASFLALCDAVFELDHRAAPLHEGRTRSRRT